MTDADDFENFEGDGVDATSNVPPSAARANSDRRVDVLEDSILQLRRDNEVLHKYNEDLLRHNETLQEILQITVDKVDMHDDMIRYPNGPVRRCEGTPPQPVDVTAHCGGATTPPQHGPARTPPSSQALQ